MEELGLNLRVARIRRGETLWTLAKKVDVWPARLSEIETGQREPTPELVQRICGALGIREAELYSKREKTDVRK